MKYNISINQLAWKFYFPDAKLKHVVVFEAIRSMCFSTDDTLLRTTNGFTWISNKLILKEVPLLDITSKSGISPILRKLEEWKLIETKNIDRNKYYKITPIADKLRRDKCTDEEFKIMKKYASKYSEKQIHYKKKNI